MKVAQSYCVFLALLLLVHQPIVSFNWQGTGILNNDNLTVIWNYINQNFKRNVDASTIQIFVADLSNHLNDMWAPAWNIVIVQIDTTTPDYNDVVLYGYAFRDHWMWYNGYIDPSIEGFSFSFVIWKDYNCQGFKTIGAYAE